MRSLEREGAEEEGDVTRKAANQTMYNEDVMRNAAKQMMYSENKLSFEREEAEEQGDVAEMITEYWVLFLFCF